MTDRTIPVRAALGALATLGAVGVVAGFAARSGSPGRFVSWALGARDAVLTTAAVVVLALFVGLVAGAVAALGPRALDAALSRTMEVAGALPIVVSAVLVSRILPGLGSIAIGTALAALRGLETAKLVRAEIRSLENSGFVMAARALGANELRLFRAHLLPHVLGPALASATLAASAIVAVEAALAFLGAADFGTNWGTLLAEAVRSHSVAGAVAPILGLGVVTLSLHATSGAIERRWSIGRRFL